jgi:hypothetical protein
MLLDYDLDSGHLYPFAEGFSGEQYFDYILFYSTNIIDSYTGHGYGYGLMFGGGYGDGTMHSYGDGHGDGLGNGKVVDYGIGA